MTYLIFKVAFRSCLLFCTKIVSVGSGMAEYWPDAKITDDFASSKNNWILQM